MHARRTLISPRTQPPSEQTPTRPTCALRTPGGQCLQPALCPADTLPIDGLCLAMRSDALEDASPEMQSNAHTDRAGNLVVYEHIPRRPDLPANYDSYLYPTEPWGGQTVSSGYDLGRSDMQQRRGHALRAVGHGGVDLPQERGAPVRALALRGQQGDAEVLYAGPLFGNTVVLLHIVRDGENTRSLLALHGHLDTIAPGLRRHQSVAATSLLGTVGDSGAEGIVHLHYEIRMLRPGINPARLEGPMSYVAQDNSVPCDPRNVLPMRSTPVRRSAAARDASK